MQGRREQQVVEGAGRPPASGTTVKNSTSDSAPQSQPDGCHVKKPRTGPPPGRDRHLFAEQVDLVHRLHVYAKVTRRKGVLAFIQQGWKEKYGTELTRARAEYFLYSGSHARRRVASRAQAFAESTFGRSLAENPLAVSVMLMRVAESHLDALVNDIRLRKVSSGTLRRVKDEGRVHIVPVIIDQVDGEAVRETIKLLLGAHDAVVRLHELAVLTGKKA